MAVVVRASRPSVSLRTSVQRSAIVPQRPVQMRFRAQQPVILRAAEESSGVDSEKLVADLKAKWEAIDNKPQFLIYSAGAIAGVWFTSVILGAVDHVPLIPKALELVGLSYSAWFTYRYLLFKSSRLELIKDVEALKEKITGGSE